MEIKLSLALPRDRMSVPVARRICTHALASLGVDEDSISDVEIALTEACTNVLDHAVDGDDYEVGVGVDGRLCVIEVVDRGHGFDASVLSDELAAPDAERGRGITIMQAVVDRVEFTSRAQSGTVCHLEKELTWAPDSPMHQLTEDNRPTEHGPWSTRRTAGHGGG